ncbi:hypothetical protein AOC36_10870 [Erysipelothrix larvae]|uniref:Integrase catalytic domain-containing protein n=1 Tax=Erysipelothrix larvae TaxID=1514105 RepID=A0A120JTZ8_9FIRM|nr:hypothetical protein AOC36_10870 [Erysipelothrix larvae]
MIHSDQGIHYTSKNLLTLIEKSKIWQAMLRRGNCWDNALESQTKRLAWKQHRDLAETGNPNHTPVQIKNDLESISN